MTKKIETTPIKPLDLEATHASSISSDQLANELANIVVMEGITPIRAILNRAKQEAEAADWQIYLSGSSFTSASANPLHFLTQKFVKVFYGLNANLIMGSAYHKALEHANKEFIENGKYPTFGKALKHSIDYVNENFKLIKSEEREEIKEADLIKEVVGLLKVYWREQLHKSTPVETEVFVSMPSPEYMLRNKENSHKIMLTGAADVVYKDGDILILSDHKTSKKPISGKADKKDALIKLEDELKKLKAELVKHQKQAAKFVDASSKLAAAKKERNEVAVKLADAMENKKTTTALEKRVTKWGTEVTKWEDNLSIYEASKTAIEALEAEISAVNELMLPQMEIYEEDKAAADLKEAKKNHGQQLAFYALLYMIVSGKDIKKVRLENMVKAKQPYLQVFEWELDDMVLAKAEEQIKANITRIELMLEGIDPLALFPVSNMTFIGTETVKLLEDIEDIALLLKKEVNGED